MATAPNTTAAQPGGEQEVTTKSRPRLSFGSRFGYGLGDLACVLLFSGLSGFLALFYTDAVGISAGVVGVIILLARVVDGIFDAVIGAVAERTRSRFGRFRPWILFGAVPLAVFAVLTFTAPFPGTSPEAVIWAIITYGILGLLDSCVNVPYAALSGVMAETPADRLSMNSMRFALSSIGLVLTGAITLPLISVFGPPSGENASPVGYTITAGIFAIIGVILCIVTFLTSRETVMPVRTELPRVKETLRAVFQNGPLFVIGLLTILAGVAFYSRLGVVVYYYIYNANAAALAAVLIPLSPVAALVGSLLFSRFATRIGKRNLFIIGSALQAIALVALYFTDATNIAWVAVFTVIHGLAGFNIPLTYSMVADAADYGEHKSGTRSDGVSFAVVSVAQKLAFAVAGVSVALLGVFGYQANVAQTPETLQGINFVVNLFPAIVAVVSIMAALLYRLTDAKAASIRTELNVQTAATRVVPDKSSN
ncbi:MFS transporter [Arthrobacter sp. SD76]|uniref:MFS transporter n=1 Tax=Arthrobacter sp. SD76 TaxID=3415007 RepID=UPI003C769D1E